MRPSAAPAEEPRLTVPAAEPQAKRSEASPPTNIGPPKNSNYLLVLLIAVPVIGILIYASNQGRPAAAGNQVATTQETIPTSSSPSIPSEPAPAPLPTIESLGADPVAETSAGWSVVIRWKVRDASRTIIAWEGMTDDDHPTKFSDQAVVDPDLGEKQIDLVGPQATVTLITYNPDGKEVKSTVSCASIKEEKPAPDPVEEVNPHLISSFEATHRSDTPEGTIFRVAYATQLKKEISVQMGEQVEQMDPNDDSFVLLISRRSKLTLHARDGDQNASKELILEPNYNVAPEAERQLEGPPLSDSLDVVSIIASQVDFSLIRPGDGDYEALHEWFLTWAGAAGKTEFMQARNAICARHGYIFRTRPDLQALFGRRRWYRGDTSDGKVLAGRFNAMEKKNIALLKAWEEHRAKNAQ